ncbi:unnamed protein product [Peniophora sp. CBMAI 1063]|nr:unnamed protein product [Peniophora sp. CBMAI 1063]
MMVQDWLGTSAGTEAPPVTESVERYALRCLHSYTALKRYGVDQLATLVIGLVHSAVVLFLVGLSLSLGPLHSVPGLSVAILSALAALLYTIASIIPLVDPQCPYRTPLGYVLYGVFYGAITFLACATLYLVNASAAVRSWVKNKKIAFRDLDPRQIWAFLGDPVSSARVLRPLLGGILHGKTNQELDQIVQRAFEPVRTEKFIAGRALAYLSAQTRAQLVKSPVALRHFARCLLNMEHKGVSDFFVNIRNDKVTMVRVARAFDRIDSVRAAVGSIRLIQMLLIAENSADNLSQIHSNQDIRWRHMAAIVSVFPKFAEQVGMRNAEALLEQDTTIVTAVASLRWTLIEALGQVQGNPCAPDHPGFQARRNLQSLLAALDTVGGLHLLKVSSNDHENIDVLLQDHSEGSRIELASRNAFTLLAAVSDCNWRPGDWKRPDTGYIPAGRPGMWEWRRQFSLDSTTVGKEPSERLSTFLRQECVITSVRARTGSAALGTLGLDPVAHDALRDLSSIVILDDATTAPSAPDNNDPRLCLETIDMSQNRQDRASQGQSAIGNIRISNTTVGIGPVRRDSNESTTTQHSTNSARCTTVKGVAD